MTFDRLNLHQNSEIVDRSFCISHIKTEDDSTEIQMIDTENICTESIQFMDGTRTASFIKIEPNFENSDSLDAQLSYYDESNVNVDENAKEATKNYHKIESANKTLSAKEKKIEFEKLFTENRHRFDMSCERCSKLFETLDDARFHYATFHNDPLGYIKCCNVKLVYRSEVVKHLYRHLEPEKFKCNQCGKVYSTIGVLKTHMKKHAAHPAARERNVVICDICKKAFTSKDYLRKHFQWHSERNKSDNEQYTKYIVDNFDMSCDRCDEVFSTFYDARRHYKIVHNEKKGYIKCCNIKLNHFWLVKDHIDSSHLNPTIFKCNFCNKNFGDRKKFYMHIRRHKEANSKPFICDYCGKHFQNKEIITRHIFTNHVQSKPKYECTTCHKHFQLVSLLKNHYYSVHREKNENATCEICGKFFNVKATFNKHMLLHLDKTERLAHRKQCDHCGEWLLTKSGIYYHKKIHTSGIQKCEQCLIEFPHRLALMAHIRNYHRKLMYKCNHCEKTFDIGSKLRKHEESHTRHNIYPCQFCNKEFTLATSRLTHQKRIHPEELKQLREMRKLTKYSV